MNILLFLQAVFTYENFVRAASGGIGNAFAISICYPLECARTRLQVDDKVQVRYSLGVIQDVYKQEGISGVYRGVVSLALVLFCSSFVYFFVFHGLKAALTLEGGDQQVSSDLIFGIIAGVAVVFSTNPMWVINTRLKLQGAKLKTDSYKQLKHPKYNGITDCLVKIIQYDGLVELWSGTKMSLMLVSNPAIQFMIYELLKRLTQAALVTTVLSSGYYFMFGAVSKTVATIVTYPLQLIQTRVRAGYTGRSVVFLDGQSFSISSCLGMYRGLESKLSQTVLTAAIMLVSYEKISRTFFIIMGVVH